MVAGFVLALVLVACGGQVVVEGERYSTFVHGASLLPRGGEAVAGGGGYHRPTSDRVAVEIPAECLQETREVAVFNPDDRPTIAQ